MCWRILVLAFLAMTAFGAAGVYADGFVIEASPHRNIGFLIHPRMTMPTIEINWLTGVLVPMNNPVLVPIDNQSSVLVLDRASEEAAVPLSVDGPVDELISVAGAPCLVEEAGKCRIRANHLEVR